MLIWSNLIEISQETFDEFINKYGLESKVKQGHIRKNEKSEDNGKKSKIDKIFDFCDKQQMQIEVKEYANLKQKR